MGILVFLWLSVHESRHKMIMHSLSKYIAYACFCWILLVPPLGLLYAQTGYVWAKGIQGAGWYDYGLDATCDDAGNVFICGDYDGFANFGGSLIYGGLGSSDMYTCRLAVDGTFEWVSRQGSASTDRNFSMRVGSDQHIYTCGYGKVLYPSAPEKILHQWDAITTRTRPDGTIAWGRAMQGDIYSEAFDIVPDAAGNSYTVGQLKTKGWYGSDTLEGHGNTDGFIVKFDSLGNYLWGKTLGGNFDDFANSVDVDAQGNLWVGGSFKGLAHFGGISLVGTGGSDAFIAKLDPNGSVLFVNAYTGPSDAEIIELQVSDDGDCYFTGDFAGSLNFPSQSFTAVDTLDIFYGKVKGTGTFAWARQAGGMDLDIPQDLELDTEENIYLGGFFFGDLQWQSASGVSAGYDDMFFAKTDSNGVLGFLEIAHDQYSRDVFGVGVDAAQNMIVTGSFSDTMTLGATLLSSSGFNTDIFVAKYATRVQQLAILEVNGTPYCVNDQFAVTFQAWGYFDAGNVFYLELSDAAGSFASPQIVGSLSSSLGGTVLGTIPPGIVQGTQYRFRIRGSLPAILSPDNGQDITLDPNTSIPVQIMGDTLLCSGLPVVLSVAAGFDHQFWSTGDSGTTIIVFQAGPIWVEATDSNGCTNTDEVLVINCVGRLDAQLPAMVKLLPNPARGEVQLQFDGALAGTYLVDIWDAQGMKSLAASFTLLGSKVVVPLNVSHLSPGIYLVMLSKGELQSRLRLVIQ